MRGTSVRWGGAIVMLALTCGCASNDSAGGGRANTGSGGSGGPSPSSDAGGGGTASGGDGGAAVTSRDAGTDAHTPDLPDAHAPQAGPDGAVGPGEVACFSYYREGHQCAETDDCRSGLLCVNGSCTSTVEACSFDGDCGHFGTCVGASIRHVCTSRSASCLDSMDCAVGSRCDPDGTCRPGPVEGERSLNGTCARGYHSDAVHVCRTRVPVDGACDCTGLECNPNPGLRLDLSSECTEGTVCVTEPSAPKGSCRTAGTETCGQTRPHCAADHLCISDTGIQGTCTAQTADLGEPCTASAIPYNTDPDWKDRGLCKKGLYCSSSGCAKLPESGAPCIGTLEFPCGTDRFCDSAGVCRSKVAEGAACDATVQCAPGTSCRAVVDSPGTCASTPCAPDRCTEGCTSATCGDGVTCCGLEQCDDGNRRAGDGCSPSCKWEPIAVATANFASCAIGGNGLVKCWGDPSAYLQTWEKFPTAGAGPDQMGDHLLVTQLGTGRRTRKLWVFGGSSCALLDDGSLKCWGVDVDPAPFPGAEAISRGDDPFEMGDHLRVRDYGPGRTVKQFVPSCALLDNGELQCSGLPDQTPGGSPVVDLGGGRKATFFDAFSSYCAVLDDGSLKCWGDNPSGELGLGYTSPSGVWLSASSLPAVNLGAGRTATSVAVSLTHTCALLDHGSVKCWGGIDNYGGVVLGRPPPVYPPDGTTQVYAPAALPEVDLGTGRTATMIVAGTSFTCALLDNGAVKCWGSNDQGQLGQGDTETRGDGPDEMGVKLLPIDLGTGRTAKSISTRPISSSVCALLDDGTVKCWGGNLHGELGLGDTNARGDEPGEMGDHLPAVDLTF